MEKAKNGSTVDAKVAVMMNRQRRGRCFISVSYGCWRHSRCPSGFRSVKKGCRVVNCQRNLAASNAVPGYGKLKYRKP